MLAAAAQRHQTLRTYRRLTVSEAAADLVLPTDDDDGTVQNDETGPAMRARRRAALVCTTAGALLMVWAGGYAAQRGDLRVRPRSSVSLTVGGQTELWSWWNPLDWLGLGGDSDESTTTTQTTTTLTVISVTTYTTLTTTTEYRFPDFQFSTSTTTTRMPYFKVREGTPAAEMRKMGSGSTEEAIPTSSSSRKHCTGSPGNCWETECCQQEGLYCFEKQPGLAACKASCVLGPDLSDFNGDHWTCKPLGDHSGVKLNLTGPVAPWVSEVCAGSGAFDSCHSGWCCRDSGMQCFQKAGEVARCRASCTPGVDPTDVDNQPWSCEALGPRTPGLAQHAAATTSDWVQDKCSEANENCFYSGCCKDQGMRCYAKDMEARLARCLVDCKPGPDLTALTSAPWNCTALGARTPGHASIWMQEDGEGAEVADWVGSECAKAGENCIDARCCAEPGRQCYVKHRSEQGSWAACKSECIPGPDVFDVDAANWSCEPLGPRSPGESRQVVQEVARWVSTNCSEIGTSCEKSRCCKDPGLQCYQKTEGWASCKAACDKGSDYGDLDTTPWSCKELGPRTPGEAVGTSESVADWVQQRCSASLGQGEDNCLETACCKESGMQCYSKNLTWGSCRPSCDHLHVDPEDGKRWECEEVGLRHPGRPPCAEDGEDCSRSACCKEKGKMCFQKDEHWATCLETCDSSIDGMESWSCKQMGWRQYGRQLGCSWAGEDCGLTKTCCQAGLSCFVKDEFFSGCLEETAIPDGWLGSRLGGPRTTDIDGSAGSNIIEPRPGDIAGDRLYCFMVVLSGSYEDQLMNHMKDRGASIFSCDVHDVLDGQLSRQESWGSVANSGVFVNIWKHVIKTNRFQEADWTVKADPDTVFFPQRLKQMIRDLQPPRNEPIYLKNTRRFNGFLGAIEVFSREAVELYAEFGVLGCHFFEEGSGEDGYFKDCMDAIGAKYMLKDEILLSNGNDALCDDVHATFHPYKDVNKWQACFDKAGR